MRHNKLRLLRILIYPMPILGQFSKAYLSDKMRFNSLRVGSVRRVGLRKLSRGFTVIELMISISILSIVMVVVMAAIVGISKQFQKSTYMAQLQDASRTIHYSIDNNISYKGGASVVSIQESGDWSLFCLNGYRYYWKRSSSSLISNPSGFYKEKKDIMSACEDSFNPEDNYDQAENMLPKNAFVAQLTITSKGSLTTVNTVFKIGRPDMFENSNDILNSACLPTQRGGDFCAVVNYTSKVINKVGSH